MKHAIRTLVRSAFVLFAALTGIYGLLAYIPFTFEAVIRFPMVSWLPGFVRVHPWLFLICLAGNLWIDRGSLARPGVRAFYLVSGLAAAGLLAHPLLAGIRNDGTSYGIALAGFLAPCWLLGLDLWAGARARAWRPGQAFEARRLLLAALGSAAFGAVVFPLLALRASGASSFSWTAAAWVWGWTLSAHLLVLLAAALAVMAALGLGRLAGRPWVELALLCAGLWLGLAWFIVSVIFVPIAFAGARAWLLAGLMAAAALGLALDTALAAEPAAGEGPLDLVLRPLARLLRGRWPALAAVALGVALAAGMALQRFSVFDWNFMFQKTVVAAASALVFAAVYATLAPDAARPRWAWALILLPVLAMEGFLGLDRAVAERRAGPLAEPRLAAVLDQQAGREVLVRLLRDALTPVRTEGRSIYAVLQQNSNIPRGVRTDPVEIQHVDTLARTPGAKPDIFVFVVDSMRRDYLGAYNPKVRFTPELDRFAAESLVMRNSFTRYGATGLSEPAIWTGSLMLHKQYITPFWPMNSLEKLLTTDGYQGLVSVDSILDVVVKPGPWLQDLDPGVGTQDLRLGASLGKLQAAIEARGQDPRPLFVYTQAQDIHISVINREGRNTVMPGDYKGFYEPYASRMQRLDADFGRFVAFLKARHRFDDSIIIVAADHGDSLGEEGRFGHAYTLFPEIVRVPLLIHLPPAMAAGLAIDKERPAFLTDITPTLYYLLGHRPVRPDRALGRPLFTAAAAEQEPYRQDRYMLASSYGAVFGILDRDCRNLYIADGVNFKDYFYRLDEGDNGARHEVTPGLKARYDQDILEDIGMLNRFYHFRQGADKGGPWAPPSEPD